MPMTPPPSLLPGEEGGGGRGERACPDDFVSKLIHPVHLCALGGLSGEQTLMRRPARFGTRIPRTVTRFTQVVHTEPAVLGRR